MARMQRGERFSTSVAPFFPGGARGFAFVCLFLLGCGGAARAPAAVPTAEAPVAEDLAASEPAVAPSSGLRRAELEAILDAGLGRFLQGVETEPHLEEGRFVGFRLRKLYPNDPRFASGPIQPGDTIVRVNGEPIERPEQALRVWQSLRVASELWIQYLRDGKAAELRVAIID